MKYLSSFPIAHAAVLSLVACIFLVDGCVNRQDPHPAPDASARKLVALQPNPGTGRAE